MNRKKVAIQYYCEKCIARSIFLLNNNFIINLYNESQQTKFLDNNYSPHTKSLIVFLSLGNDIICGGILSIVSLCAESQNMKDLHRSEVILCTIPGEPNLLHYTKFENNFLLFKFSQILRYFYDLNEIIIHIPEMAIESFLTNLREEDWIALEKVKKVHFNIMLQNIALLSDISYINELKRYGKVTCTTAHTQYSTIEMQSKLEIPLHKLSVFISPENYENIPYQEKDNLMIVSPDFHPHKELIIKKIKECFPELRILIIKNLRYEEYKKIISKAKWCITFGEGLDGYFIETIFSGGISFAIYNNAFFTDDFKGIKTVYDDFDGMLENICNDIASLGENKNYTNYQNVLFGLCHKYYNYEIYLNNIKQFYMENYSIDNN